MREPYSALAWALLSVLVAPPLRAQPVPEGPAPPANDVQPSPEQEPATGTAPATEAQPTAAPEAVTAQPPSEVPTPPSAASTEGDIVETIGASEDSTNTERIVESSETTPAASPAAESEKYALSAWAREELEVLVRNHGAQEPSLAVPRDRAISRTQAFVRFGYSRGHWLQVQASADVNYSYFMEGLGSSLSDDIEHHRVRANVEPTLRELYLGFFTSRLDVRLGQQRLAWGRADTQSPNDILNARDLRDPLTRENDLFHRPTPLARVDYDLGGAGIQVVFSPFFVPDRFDLYGSNWAFVQPGAPRGLRGFFHGMSRLVDVNVKDEFNRLVQQTSLPAPQDSLSAGTKLSTTLDEVDLAFYYHYGFDRTPLVKITPAFAELLDRADFSQATPADFAPFFSAIAAGQPPLSITYVRRHHVGVDAATTLGPVGVRVDAAYDSRRVFFRRDLTGIESAAVEGTLSLEYQTGDIRKVFLLEGSVLRLFDAGNERLLFVKPTSFNVTALLRYPLFERFDVELRARAGFEPQSLVLRPQLSYKPNDHLAISLGAAWLSGKNSGFGGYFSRNSSVITGVKYAF